MPTLPPHSEAQIGQLSFVIDPELPSQVLLMAAERLDSPDRFIKSRIDVPDASPLSMAATDAVSNLLEGEYMHPDAQMDARRAFRRGAGLVLFVLASQNPARSLINDLAEFGRVTNMRTARSGGVLMSRFTGSSYAQHAMGYQRVVNTWSENLYRKSNDPEYIMRGIGYVVGVAAGLRDLRIELIVEDANPDAYWDRWFDEGEQTES